MCKCNECDKINTEYCMIVMESCGSQQRETVLQIEIDALRHNYDNLLKGIEKMIQTMASESFWKIKNIEKENE